MTRKSISALAVMVALVAYVLVFERDTSAPGSLAALSGIPTAEVQAVEWKAKDGLIRISRASGWWRVDRPVVGPADPVLADAAVDEILNHAPGRVLEGGGWRSGDYALSTPRFELSYELSTGRRVRLRFGALNPSGLERYARSSASDRIFLVRAADVDALEARSAESAMDHRLLDFAVSQVQRLTITGAGRDRGVGDPLSRVGDPSSRMVPPASAGPGTTLDLSRRGASWQMTRPWSAPVDDNAVSTDAGILARLERTHIQRFLLAPPALARCGLEPPATVIQVRLGDGRSCGLALGSHSPDGIYGRRLDGSAIFILRLADARALAPAPQTLVDLALTPPIQDLRSFRIRSPRGTLAASKVGVQWRADRGSKRSANLVLEALGMVADLRGTSVLSFKREDRYRYGLSDPMMTITAVGPGNTVREVRLGHPLNTGTPACRTDSPVISTIPSAREQALERLSAGLPPTPTPQSTDNDRRASGGTDIPV